METFVNEWLGALMTYDSDHGAHLVATLSEFLDCGGSYDVAAAALTSTPQHAQVPAQAHPRGFRARHRRP